MVAAELTDPNLAFLLIVLGTMLIYWELHAPGLILPGVIGLALALTGAYGLYQNQLSSPGLTLLFLALLLLAIEVKYYTHMISGLAGIVLLVVGSIILVHGPRSISPALAIPLAAAFGAITIFLGSLAMRARRNKSDLGVGMLVGEIGTARTDIDPRGTIMVRGEYWQAHSQQPISAGQHVRVQNVRDMVLEVEVCDQ